MPSAADCLGLECLKQDRLADAPQTRQHQVLKDCRLFEQTLERFAFGLSTGEIRGLVSCARPKGVLERRRWRVNRHLGLPLSLYLSISLGYSISLVTLLSLVYCVDFA